MVRLLGSLGCALLASPASAQADWGQVAQRWADEFLAQQSAAVAREPIDR